MVVINKIRVITKGKGIASSINRPRDPIEIRIEIENALRNITEILTNNDIGSMTKMERINKENKKINSLEAELVRFYRRNPEIAETNRLLLQDLNNNQIAEATFSTPQEANAVIENTSSNRIGLPQAEEIRQVSSARVAEPSVIPTPILRRDSLIPLASSSSSSSLNSSSSGSSVPDYEHPANLYRIREGRSSGSSSSGSSSGTGFSFKKRMIRIR